MARSSVPQRRSRAVEDDESSDSSSDEVPSREPPRKRLRSSVEPSTQDDSTSQEVEEPSDGTSDETRTSLEDEPSVETGAGQEDGETPEGPTDQTGDGDVLPDSYRRSPKSKTRTKQTHQPGSIVRVSLENFVTYSKSEFWPGPHLNMVIGPNGTGKSTLVCAICLGLGWSTKHLGRAKHISEFVKHGSKIAKIEIELAADPARHSSNPIIRTKISRDSETPDFFIDDKKCPKKHVQALARSFAIQVDNLCQFLPQDRVAEFATLSPVRLLEETQRAAAPEYMSQQHASLIELGSKQKEQVMEQNRLVEQLKSLESRQRAQQADVERLRQRSTLQSRLAMLEKAKVFPEYGVARARYDEVKQSVRQSKADRDRLEAALEPRMQVVREKEAYISRLDEALQPRKRVVERHELAMQTKLGRCESAEEAITIHKGERDQQSKRLKEVRHQRAKAQHNIQKLQEKLQVMPPIFDPAAMNADIRDKTRDIREQEERRTEVEDKLRTMRDEKAQKMQRIAELEKRKQHMQSQLGQQTSRLERVSRDSAKAWDWLQINRHLFAGPVFGPVMIECSVKDQGRAAAIEMAIGRSDLLSFTVSSKSDFDIFQQKLYGEFNFKAEARVSPDLSSWRQRKPCSDEQVKQLGLDGWLIDMLDGPQEVIAALCDNKNLDGIGYVGHNLTAAQSEALSKSPVISWVTPREYSHTTRRREYGEAASTTRVQSVGPAQFFTASAVNRDAESQTNSDIADLSMDCEQLVGELQTQQGIINAIDDQLVELRAARQALQAEKDAKQNAQSVFDSLPTKIEGEQAKLTACDEKMAQIELEKKSFEDKANELQLKHAQAVIDYANSVGDSRGLHMQVIEVELLKIEAASDVSQLKRQDESERQQLEAAKLALDRLVSEKLELKTKATKLSRACKTINDEASDEEKAVIVEVKEYTVEQMQVEIESTSAQLEMNTGGNINVLREFEDRARKIDEKHAAVDASRSALEELKQQINEIRSRWEPELDAIVNRISSAFSDNFAAISCAGEVSVFKDDEDFDKWAIQIKVKFRDSEALSILDSHRQSGGERSVSTIFYLMALQSLARAPFRVVDEINQGMDPRNERMVHSRLVSIACEARREDGGGGSQYFLITPKLLTGLEYHENMKIHCIASGEWMPDDQSSLNFATYAQKALALRSC